MEQLDSSKDKELKEELRPNRVQAMSHFFLAAGVILIAMIVMGSLGAGIAILVSGIEISELTDQSKIAELMNYTNSLRIMNLFGASLAFIVGAWATTKAIKADSLGFLSADRFPKGKWLLWSLIFFLLSIPIMSQFLEWNASIDLSSISPGLHEWASLKDGENNRMYEVMLGNGSTWDFVLNILLMAAIPALAEELVFRGLILNILNGLFKNIHAAIFVSALIFTSLHLQVYKVLPMMLLAVSFGYLVYWTGSVWTAVIAHFFNNAVTVISLQYFTDGSYEEVLQQDQDLHWSLVLIAAIGFVLVFRYLNKMAQPKLQRFYV